MRTTGRRRLALIIAGAALAAGAVGCQPDDGYGVETLPSASADPSPGTRAPSPATPEPTSPSPDAKDPGATPRVLVTAPVAGGLRRASQAEAVSDVPVDPGEMREDMHLVVANYRVASDRLVLFEGVDNVREDTSKRREHLFRGMLDHIGWDYELGQPAAEPVPAGPLGGSVECALASLSDSGDVVCGWADFNTAAVAHFPDSTLREAGALFVRMRSDLEK
ncbi:hypothetical protein [Streptomyces sp. ODS05-4]|uniref:hypothetical protein n=1 Tax=Streptomyces sp. ODS05-4 TaxID=2944939 RepID=UPI00210D8965|nr:hypothetical protein [Streptomyces sp. ODS05-4]